MDVYKLLNYHFQIRPIKHVMSVRWNTLVNFVGLLKLLKLFKFYLQRNEFARLIISYRRSYIIYKVQYQYLQIHTHTHTQKGIMSWTMDDGTSRLFCI